MGFPSPATDYIERRISITSLCNLGANTLVVETSDGYAVIDVSRRPQQGDTVLVRYDGRAEFAKLMGRALSRLKVGRSRERRLMTWTFAA
jgi:DNA polymerase V